MKNFVFIIIGAMIGLVLYDITKSYIAGTTTDTRLRKIVKESSVLVFTSGRVNIQLIDPVTMDTIELDYNISNCDYQGNCLYYFDDNVKPQIY